MLSDLTGSESVGRSAPVSVPNRNAKARRLADEYDAAQERGEVAKAGNPNCSKAEQLPGPKDIGLSRKQIHEARAVLARSPPFAQAILAGGKSLDEAYNEPLCPSNVPMGCRPQPLSIVTGQFQAIGAGRTARGAVPSSAQHRARSGGEMFNRKFVAAAVLLGGCLVSISSLQIRAADISKSLVGTWRVASLSTMTLETKNEMSRPFGENPNGYLQYSKWGDAGRHNKGQTKNSPPRPNAGK